MGLPLTFSLLAGTVAAAVFCGWSGARPADPRRGPRRVPWRFLMLLSASGAVLLLVHLLNLLGLRTGG